MKKKTHVARFRKFTGFWLVGFCSWLASGALVTGCTEEPTRQSSVDVGSLCTKNAEVNVGGQCLRRGAPESEPEPRPRAEPERDDDDPQPEPEPEPRPRAAPERERDVPQPAPESAPAPAPASETLAEEARQREEELRRERLAAQGRQDRAQQEVAGAPATSAVPRSLKFKKDTFVAIADDDVLRNCLIPSETVITFKGELAPLVQFKSFGVSQEIVMDVVSVEYPSSTTKSSCLLQNHDFVFLSGHAELLDAP